MAFRSWRSAVEGSYDFDGFWEGGRRILDAGLLHDGKMLARYLPQFQVLHVPFALLPIGLAGLVWYLLSVAALLATPRELERLSGMAPRAQIPAWFVALPFVIDNLHLGQSGVVVLWATLFAVNRARDGASAWGGSVLGITGVAKIPALALAAPVVLLGRPVRAIGALLASAAVVTGLLIVAVGWQETRDHHVQWYQFVRTHQTPAGMVKYDHALRHNNQSIPIALVRTFGKLKEKKRRQAPVLLRLDREVIWSVSSIIIGILALIGLACAVRARQRRSEREAWLTVTALSALGMLFVSPLVWTHYFVFALPALVALRARPRTLLTIGLISIAGLAFRPARQVGVHTWLCVALYVTLAWRFFRSPPADSASSPDASLQSS